LTIPAPQSQEEIFPKPGLDEYTSKGLPLFVENLERRQEVGVLDVGPVCGENINFFAHRINKLYVCDVFLRLHRAQRDGQPPSLILQYLDYPPESFDGVLLWDLVDHFDNQEAGRLVEWCFPMVKLGGMVMVLALKEGAVSPVVNSFVIMDRFRVYLRPQYHLDLPFYGRQNREVLEAFAPFTLAKSFIYRNGLREFLFRRLATSEQEASTPPSYKAV
jgi:hypothetical protein